MTTCPHCSRESDRLAPILESRLVEVNRALGLDPFALHGDRMARLRDVLRVERHVVAMPPESEPPDLQQQWREHMAALRGAMERAADAARGWRCGAT